MENIDLTNTDIWREIPGYDGKYYISNFGQVYTLKTNKLLKQNYNTTGYLHLALSHKGKMKTCKIHRLVAIAFIPNPNNKNEVNHIDGVKENNHVDNLEWNTSDENLDHAVMMGKIKKRTPIMRTDLRTNEVVVYRSIADGVKDLYPQYKNLKTRAERRKFINGRTSNIRRVLTGKLKHFMNYHYKEI